MARQTINIGTNPNDGTGDPLRNAYDKCNDNFLELYEEGGANITVNNPVTSTETTLDDALADLVGGGGGGAVDSVNGQTGVVALGLTEILTESNLATDLPVKLEDSSLNTYIEYTGFDTRIKEIGTNNNIFNYGGFGNFYVWDGVSPNYKQQFSFDPSGAQGQNFILPSKPTGNYTIATLDDIPSSSAYKFVQTSQTPHTGTILETLIATATINGGTFSTSDVAKALFGINKTGTLGTYSLRLRVNTLNTLVGATQVALFTSAGTSAQMSIMSRSFSLNGGNLYGYSFTGNALTDIASIGGALSSTSYNTANTLYFFWTVQLANAGDSITPNLTLLTN